MKIKSFLIHGPPSFAVVKTHNVTIEKKARGVGRGWDGRKETETERRKLPAL